MIVADLLDKLRNIPGVLRIEEQASVDKVDGETLVLVRIYIKTEKPPDLGIHVSDGIQAKIKRVG